jgi:hypothetical protein
MPSDTARSAARRSPTTPRGAIRASPSTSYSVIRVSPSTPRSTTRMPPRTPRSSTRRQVAETNKDLTDSRSTTGKETRVRRAHPPYIRRPIIPDSHSFEFAHSSDRSETPHSDDEDGSQGYPTDQSTEISDADEGATTPRRVCTEWSTTDQAIVERELARLEAQKRSIKERMSRMKNLVDSRRQHRNHEPEPTQLDRPVEGPKLPVGVLGFGRQGTWMHDDSWRPNAPTPSTTELPTARDPRRRDEQEVEDLLFNGDSQ